MSAAHSNRIIVVLSTADFDADVWTNKQHLASGLATRGHNVFYVESLGLRQPTLRLRDIKRLLSKALPRLKRSTGSQTRTAPATLSILTPRVIPFHGIGFVRMINRWLVDRSVIRRLPRDSERILWSFSPLTYGLERAASQVIYHSVDLLHTISGVPSTSLLLGERNLIARADAVIASSTVVRDHLRAMGAADPLLWENVASTELFERAAARANREPRAIFAGNLTPSKVDISLLEGLAVAGVKLVLAGPIAIDGSRGDEFRRLLSHPGVTYLGNLSLEDLAEATAASTVGLIPYKVNDYTRGVFPMKVFEYLSAGLPVVATPLPSLADRSVPGLTVCSRTEFFGHVHRLIPGTSPEEGRLIQEFARSRSWSRRLDDVEGLLQR